MQHNADSYRASPYGAANERRSHSRGRLSGLRDYFKAWWRRALDKRMPASRSIDLGHKNLFIFPTKAGFYFLFVLLLLLLLAINFENNLVYLLVFWLGGVFVVSIIHTFSCLNGLTVIGSDAKPSFAGADTSFPFALRSNRQVCRGVTLSWQNVSSERCDVELGQTQQLNLRYHTGPRGIVTPGRVKLESTFPLGLLRCWTWVDLQQKTTVYPRPDKDAAPLDNYFGAESGPEDSSVIQRGSDDFDSLRSYRSGDSSKHIAWRQYAKTGKLATKEYINYVDQRLWLDWNNASGNIEQRLSQLCHWAIQAESRSSDYGLKLPGVAIEPSRGPRHLHELLTELAIYENGSGARSGSTP